ncbi:DUF1802 family protein [Desmospora profundinema]|uniref:DUF1802 family protein n=1 Tax=Desmospora profundinema TaxID=1571184 RepID=A0ABU1IJR7_9BACL|nr:DUF1802 family protein [Desmospora profundinema]MDR6224931.1 hypothetical protein [Desmospora profundinema]
MKKTIQTLPPIALKEWAAVVEALGEGKQILLMRKGGIHEETRQFQVENDTFPLFPNAFHQKTALIKPAFHTYVNEELAGGSSEQESVSIRYVARLVEDIEVFDEATLARLAPFHIWTDNFAVERLKWKKKHPLHVLLLRIFRLSESIAIPMRAEYLGCKSWIRLPDNLPQRKWEPVLSDAAFDDQRKRIKEALKG